MTEPTPTPKRRRWRLLLIVLAAVILLPVAAVAVLVATFDADSAKPRIIAAVEAATGRKLVIDGPIRLVPALHPSIELTDASLSNPPGFSRPQMAVLKQLNLQLALLPLLQRRIEIDSLAVRGADILLEMGADGTGNWRFTPAPAASHPAEPVPQPAAAKSPPPAIHIDRIDIQDGQIAYRNAKMTDPVSLAISALTVTTGTADQPINLTLAASLDATPLTLTGRVGPSSALFGVPDLPLNIDLTAASAGAKLSLAGTIANPLRLSGTDLRLAADIPDLAALSGLARTGLPTLKGIAAQARLTDLAGKPGLLSGFTLHELKLAMPQAQLDGDIAVTRGSPPLLQGTLHAARIDGDALRAARPVPAPASAPAPASTAAAAPAPPPAPSPKRFIPDQELPFDLLHALDADLTVAIGELVQGGVTYRDLAGHVVLAGAVLRLDPFTATVPGGPVRLSLTVDAAKPAPPVALTLSAPSIGLAPFLTAFSLPRYAQGNLRVDADVHGTGRSPHQIAATLDGSIGLSMENAQVDARSLGDVLNALEPLKNSRSGFTELRCLAARMDARNGAGTLRALLLDTAPASVSGSGGLNLGEETLALRLQTTIRMGATGIGAPLDVGGTFLAPKVKIDAAAPLGALAGAAANAGGNTPFGIVIGRLGLNQLVPGASGESCAHELAIARGDTPPPAAAPAPAAPAEPSAQPAAKAPKPADLLRQLLR